MKVAITSPSGYEDLMKEAADRFRLIGYTDIVYFIGSKTVENIDIVCLVGLTLPDTINTYRIERGDTCNGSREFIEKHNKAVLCMYVKQTETIYRAKPSFKEAFSLTDRVLTSTLPLEYLVPPVKVDNEVKPDVYYLTENVSMKGYHYLKSKFPHLDAKYFTCDISKASFPNLREQDLVFLDFRENKFVLDLSFKHVAIRNSFRNLIGRKNTFLMYEPAYEQCKIPYRLTSTSSGLDITITGAAGTTKDIYELIEKSTKKPINESVDQTEIPDKPLKLKSMKPIEETVREYRDSHYDKYEAIIDSTGKIAKSLKWYTFSMPTSNNVLLLKNKKR